MNERSLPTCSGCGKPITDENAFGQPGKIWHEACAPWPREVDQPPICTTCGRVHGQEGWNPRHLPTYEGGLRLTSGTPPPARLHADAALGRPPGTTARLEATGPLVDTTLAPPAASITSGLVREQQWRAPIDGVYASPDGSTHALEAGDPAPQQQLPTCASCGHEVGGTAAEAGQAFRCRECDERLMGDPANGSEYRAIPLPVRARTFRLATPPDQPPHPCGCTDDTSCARFPACEWKCAHPKCGTPDGCSDPGGPTACRSEQTVPQEALPPNPFDELKTRIVAIVDPLIADRDRLLEALAQIEQQAAHEHYGHATNGRNITAEQFKRIERIAERARLNPHQETTTT